jgi:2-polyprenyl-3-methyl-5-hydroxy-6-metoxy-1,4-benzoquinol methylase
MGIPAATLEGALVMLPRAAPFPQLARLRSPAWALLLPGSIIVGTFGLLLPSMALAVLLLSAVMTPVLALLAILFAARARWLVLAVGVIAVALAALAPGPGAGAGMGVLTALACLTVGTALQRLTPWRWLLIGVVAMSAVDVTLLAAGFGYHQTALLGAASNSFPGPRFTGARIGATTIGYPDLCLAALFGAALAGGRDQVRAAVMLSSFAIAMDSLLSPGKLLPATAPTALALVIISWWRHRRRDRSGAPAARAGSSPSITSRTGRPEPGADDYDHRLPGEVTTDMSMLERLVTPAGKDVVAIGCGGGRRLVRDLTGRARMTGMEISEAQLAGAVSADRGSGAQYHAGRAQALPLSDGSVDLAVFTRILHHVPPAELGAALAEAWRVLAPGGAVYVAEPLAEGDDFALTSMVEDALEVRHAAQAALAP